MFNSPTTRTTQIHRPRSHKRYDKRITKRFGFTLVEILVVITVIGILAGLLAAGVLPALRAAKEAAINVEMQNMAIAIESFKSQYGFYPPSFERSGTVGIQNANDLRKYVNRISPNNSEGPLLDTWWTEVGRHLDGESSLVFWLSGVCKNKQYPITGGPSVTQPLAAHNLGPDGIERDVFFEFKAEQLVGNDSDETVTGNGSGTTISAGDALQGFILDYKQPHGPSDGDTLYRYRDSNSYATAFPAYFRGLTTTPPIGLPIYINAKSFQLVAPGMDGLPGDPGNAFDAVTAGNGAEDNIVNFANGRLGKWVIDNE